MTHEEILSRFQVIRRYSDKAQCRCPCHDDKQASLTISKGRKGAMIYCHAGCGFEDIIRAVGLKKQDLFYEFKPPNSNWRAYIESREKRRIEAVYNYVSFNDNYAFTKIRMQEKKMIYGMLSNGRFTYGLGGRSRKELCAVYVPNGIQDMNRGISEGKPIFIPEGERDVDILVKQGYIALTYGGVNDWTLDMAQLFKGAVVYVLADNDESGRRVANTIQSDLQGIAKSAKVIVPVPDIPKADISDYFEAGHSREEFEQLLKETVTEDVDKSNSSELSLIEVKGMLSYDEHGKVIQSVRNFEIVLENDSRFAGKVGFNEFSRQVSLLGSVPWDLLNNSCRAWGNHDDSALFSIIQTDYVLRNRNDYFDSVKIVSMRNKFHPVRNLLDSLPWKGIGHIKRLLVDYLGAENTEYQFQVMRLWMLGAVSRIYKPGCKFDYTLILLGPQGWGKSTFLRLMALMDEWYNDSLDNLDSDKTAQSLIGSWIIELAELKSLARTSGGIDSIKRFLTAQQDKFRAPYERRAEIIQRQCVFSGTTNHEEFLQDLTGNRRFLIVEVGINKPNKSLFAPEVVEDIKAAWAEAVHIFKTENPELILPEEFREQAEKLQNQSLVDDGKTGIIEAYLEDKTITCAVEVWQEALNESGRPAKWQAIEINEIISKLDGWKKMKSPTNIGKFGRQRGFRKNDTKTVTENSTADEFVAIGPSETIDLPFE